MLKKWNTLLSILTILLDKQLMKSFENINILIKVKLLIKVLESFYLKKDCHLKEKNAFFEKKLFFGIKLVVVKKNLFLEQKTFFEKKFFLKKFLKIFFYLWRLRVPAHNRPAPKRPSLKVVDPSLPPRNTRQVAWLFGNFKDYCITVFYCFIKTNYLRTCWGPPYPR